MLILWMSAKPELVFIRIFILKTDFYLTNKLGNYYIILIENICYRYIFFVTKMPMNEKNGYFIF